MDKSEALDRLEVILHDLYDLGEQANDLFREHFPELYSTGKAYEVFKFGESSNPHDTTFSTLVYDALVELEEEEEKTL